MFLFSDMLYMLVRYVCPIGPSMCFRCLVLTLSSPVDCFTLFYCRLDLCCGDCYFCCLQCVFYLCICLCCVFYV